MSEELGHAIELTQEESRARAIAELDPSKRVAFVSIPGDPLKRYVQVETDGTTVNISDAQTPPPAQLSVTAINLAQFPSVANLWHVKAVLVATNCVVGLVEPTDRRERVNLPLPFTDAFKLVTKWEQRTPMNQADVVRLLRLELAECVVDDTATKLLKFAESFQVNSTGTQQQTLKRDRESLGRSVMDEVSAEAGTCPEFVILSVQVHNDQSISARHNIKVQVDFSPSSSQFFVKASEHDIQRALEAQLASSIGCLTSLFGEGGPTIVGGSL